jgi:hypothetical protein
VSLQNIDEGEAYTSMSKMVQSAASAVSSQMLHNSVSLPHLCAIKCPDKQTIDSFLSYLMSLFQLYRYSIKQNGKMFMNSEQVRTNLGRWSWPVLGTAMGSTWTD